MNLPETQDGGLVAYYDFKRAPITFDFVHYIIAAHSYAMANGFPNFDLVLLADAWRNFSTREKTYSLVERRWRLWNLIVEIAKVVPSIRNLSILSTPLNTFAAQSYPHQYHPTLNKKIPYDIPTVTKFHQVGVDVQVLTPSAYATAAVERLVPRDGRKVVSLTLRKSVYDEIRNSKIEECYKFAKELMSRGHEVIVIPDQDDALGDQTINQYDWRVMDVSAMSIDLRLALYHRSDMNYVTNGGLIGIFLYSKVPFSWYSVTVEDSHVASEKFYLKLGLEPGGKYPWLTDNQEMRWEPDTYENLMESLERLKFEETPIKLPPSEILA